MRIEPQTLDAQEPFRLLGLDSMLSVEFVAALNARYGTRIAATALYEHPTPQALARHVAAELGTPRPPPPPPHPHPPHGHGHGGRRGSGRGRGRGCGCG